MILNKLRLIFITDGQLIIVIFKNYDLPKYQATMTTCKGQKHVGYDAKKPES